MSDSKEIQQTYKKRYSLEQLKSFTGNKAFLDAEFNCKEFNKDVKQNLSLLEIGLIITDADYNVLEIYDRMVKPMGEKAVVNGFVKRLTGIKQEDIDKATTTYADVVRDVNAICSKWNAAKIFCYGNSDRHFFSWNTKDTQLNVLPEETIEHKLLDVEFAFRDYIKQILPDVPETPPTVSLELLVQAVCGKKAGTHRALADTQDLLLVYKTVIENKSIDRNFIEILIKYNLFRKHFIAMQNYILQQKPELRADLKKKLFGCLFNSKPVTEGITAFIKNNPYRFFNNSDLINMISYYSFLIKKDKYLRNRIEKSIRLGEKIAKTDTFMKYYDDML